jgi:NAD(P)H-dependent FMN reductase
MRVLLIAGTVVPNSSTRRALLQVCEMLQQRGAETEIWDLAQRPVPIADPRYFGDPLEHPDPSVKRLLGAAREADGFILASPVYHNSYSGVIKNCLDHLSVDHFLYKPVGLIACGLSLSAIQVCDQLRIVVRGLRGVALPTQVVAVSTDFKQALNGEGRECDGLADRLEALVVDLMAFSEIRKVALGGRLAEATIRAAENWVD